MNAPTLPVSPLADLQAIALTPSHEALLQRFFERNPAYFLAVAGEAAGANEAHEEIHGDPPPGFPFKRRVLFGYARSDGELDAMAHVIEDLLAPGVWHIGLFIVATARHGRGDAAALYRSLEQWARAGGATFMRLGVAAGNTRAERFWASMGFAEVRTRAGVQIGKQTNTIRVMVKPLAGESIETHLARVPRDRAQAD